jgi:hypothetical protein
MATLPRHAPRRRARRLWLGLTGVLLLVALAGSWWWWWHVLTALSDEERPFVGSWRLASPVFSPSRPELVTEFTLMPDRSMRERVWDSRTGAVLHNRPGPARWYVSNGRLQQVIAGNRLHGVGDMTVLDVTVTWEGPDRFRYQKPSDSRTTLIWSRCERTGQR